MSDKDTLEEAKAAFKLASDSEAEQRVISLEDLRFVKMEEQWPEKIKKQREQEGRPCLTMNRLKVFTKQVVNDSRQNKPAIRCLPVGNGADKETAEIYSDLIRNIEISSNADVAYDTAVDFSVTSGLGYIVVRTDYTSDDAFDQDIQIERVANPFSIYGDPYSTGADSADWNTAFICDMMKKAEFERRWPKADTSDFRGDGFDSKDTLWFQGESIQVAEYWKRDEVPVELLKLSDGSIMMAPEYEKLRDLLQVQNITVDGTRTTKTHKVTQFIMNGSEILEKNAWAGKYIPIIPVYGDEVNIEGKRYFYGLIHSAKDAQRQYNFWRTATTELVALAPKAPYIGAKGQFDSDPRWQSANNVSYSNLEYDPVAGMPPPQRQGFAGPPAGALQEALNASDDMKNIVGLHDASLGARSNETSGRAIMARQREGDVATFHYIDNLSRAIRHTGRILVDLIPKVYSVERIIRCIKEDGTSYPVPVNQKVVPQEVAARLSSAQQMAQPMPPGAQAPQMQPPQQPPQASQQPPQNGQPQYQPVPPGLSPEQELEIQGLIKVFDLTTGKYDVTVQAGPSYTTRRQEASESMMEFLRVLPQAGAVAGDLVAKAQDWPGADEFAKRLAPPAGNPQLQQMQQQMQQMQAEMGQMKKALDDKQGEMALKARELGVKEFDAQTKRMEMMKPEAQQPGPVIDPLEVKRLEQEDRKLDIEAYSAETARLQALGATITPEAVQAIAMQTVQQALSAEPISEPDGPKEPQQIEPPPGGFFMGGPEMTGEPMPGGMPPPVDAPPMSPGQI